MLDVLGQGSVKVGPKSLVRFGEVGDGSAGDGLRLVLETGEMEVDAADADVLKLVLGGPGGESVRLRKGAKVRWHFDEAERLRLDVSEGEVEVLHEGESTELGAGESFLLGEAERLPDESERADAGGPAKAEAGVGDADVEPDEGITIRGLRGVEVEIKAPGEESFKRARRGKLALVPGTAIKVTGRKGLELPGPGGAAVLLQPGSSAVFGGTQGERLKVGLNGGSAEARSSGSGVAALTVPGGSAETAHLGGAPTFAAKVRDRGSTTISVRSGAALVRSGDRVETVYTGGEAVLGAQKLSVVTPHESPPVFQGSAVVYDPQRMGNFTVRFQAIEGCSTYAVHVKRGGSTYVEAVTDRPMLVVTNAEYGDYQWRATCVVDGSPDWSKAQEGRVTRRGDSSGSFTLPTKAPRSSLDSDGRVYTVTYQNRLPEITLRWSKAPPASGYSLEVVDDRTGRKVHKSRSARAARGFRSGFFKEGRYYWFFRAEGVTKGAASPITSAIISFDNVTPAIQIIEPREGASASGTVRLRGVATVGSKIQANGVDVNLGGDYRFDQQVPVGRGNMLIIRVTAPRRGTGYYIRHLN